MREKFIEGTNQQYSIREDGAVIRNYRKSKNQYGECFSYERYILKPCDKYGYVYIRLNGNKNCKVINPQKLLLIYFKHRNCAKCNNIFYSDNHKRRVCDSCKKEAVRLQSKKWANENRELKKIINNRYSKYMRKVMTNNYVITRMGCRKGDLPEDIIVAKREQLKLYRIIKNHKS